ncbi:pentapeptide repeat-containing protein [Streptomyces kanasensis]|uniref:pentapeptide repeat-containing protein n=1 Tax=Streptomyces kanasensis TaxID=936756 RepID=UPI0037F6E45B
MSFEAGAVSQEGGTMGLGRWIRSVPHKMVTAWAGQSRWKRGIAHVLAALSAILWFMAGVIWYRNDLTKFIPDVSLILVFAALPCASAAASLYRRARRPTPPIRWWWVVLAFSAVAAAVWITMANLWPETDHITDSLDRTRQRNEIVRTALAAGAGVGAAITVLLTFRRQHHHEMATEKTEHDAYERRVTELYTTAVEQLGSPHAAIRLGGLYALERLGQTAPDHRQTIVNVICAYLRMPYTPPADTTPRHDPQPAALSRARQAIQALTHGKPNDQPRQEVQVRLTAERILADHLRDTRPPEQRKSTPPDDKFWEGMRIDLAYATLTEWDFHHGHVTEANFSQATFTRPASFNNATFTGPAHFWGARFTADAWFREATFIGPTYFKQATVTEMAQFDGATFAGPTWFEKATVKGPARFVGARFTGDAWFGGATFTGPTWFERATFTGATAIFKKATFTGHAWFEGATFSGSAQFEGARFGGFAQFDGVTFIGPAQFDTARFIGPAQFDTARFIGPAQFDGATFIGPASFGKVTFSGPAHYGNAMFTHDPLLHGARVTHLVTPEGGQMFHVWPPDWSVRPVPGGEGVLERSRAALLRDLKGGDSR